MESDNIVKTVPFNKATLFLKALSPRSKPWQPLPDKWIFRGQRNADEKKWKLIPSAFRPDSWTQFEGLFGQVLQNKYYENQQRLNLEINAVWWFAKTAYHQGLPVPGFNASWLNPDEKFDNLLDVFFANEKIFRLDEWGPIFGLAQHYGIPTRLLDWTESAYIAAYFAAYKAAKHVREKEKSNENQEDIGKQIVVWAVNKDIFEEISIQHEEEIHVVRAPLKSNPNLEAQKGLFTIHHIKQDPYDLGNLEKVNSLDEVIKNLIKSNKTNKFSMPVMYRLLLDIEESRFLLYLLHHQEGISAASVFPGYLGVAQSLKELRYHRRPNWYIKELMKDINQNHKDRQ